MEKEGEEQVEPEKDLVIVHLSKWNFCPTPCVILFINIGARKLKLLLD